MMPENWLVLLEPSGPETMIGGWPLAADNTAGPFHPNPDYRPPHAGAPTDPVDAVLRLVAAGKADADALIATLRAAVLEVAFDDDHLVVAPAPDGVPCVLVVTAAAHREQVAVTRWGVLTLPELVDLLPVGVDILLNPGGPAATRVLRDACEGGP